CGSQSRFATRTARVRECSCGTIRRAMRGPGAAASNVAHNRAMHLPLHDEPRRPHTTYSAGGGQPLGLGPLQGSRRADVAIGGGGLAGCWAALHAAEAGAGVVLVEANEIGGGASGRNAGHPPPATKHDPDQIIARYGPAAGQRLIDAAEQGPV